MKKLFAIAIAAALTVTSAAIPVMAENETADSAADPAATVEPAETTDPEATVDPTVTSNPVVSDPEATIDPEATLDPTVTLNPEISEPEPTPEIIPVEPPVSMQSAFVGKVKSVEDGYSNIELADGNMSVSTYTDGVEPDEYVLLAYTSSGDMISKISSWFYDEFLGTSVTFEIPAKTDYTASATRLDFTEMIYYYLVSKGNPLTTESNGKFTDTNSMAVASLNAIGIINGVSDTEFAPDSALDRETAATIIARAYDYEHPGNTVAASGSAYADDSEISDWAKDGVYKLSTLNMMKGTGDNMFSPKSVLTLEQSLATVLRNDSANDPAAMPAPSEPDTAPVTDGTETAGDNASENNTDTQIPNPGVSYASAADVNAALSGFAIADILDAASYTASYTIIDNLIAQSDYTSGEKSVSVRKAIKSDALGGDISGIYGGADLPDFTVIDYANDVAAEDVMVAVKTLDGTYAATWTIDDCVFAVVLSGAAEDTALAELQTIVQDVVNTTPRG